MEPTVIESELKTVETRESAKASQKEIAHEDPECNEAEKIINDNRVSNLKESDTP